MFAPWVFEVTEFEFNTHFQTRAAKGRKKSVLNGWTNQNQQTLCFCLWQRESNNVKINPNSRKNSYFLGLGGPSPGGPDAFPRIAPIELRHWRLKKSSDN